MAQRSRSRIVVWWDVPEAGADVDPSLELYSHLEATRAATAARDAGYLTVSRSPNSPADLTVVMANVVAFHAYPYGDAA